MKKQKQLSDLIKQAMNSKPEHSLGEVKNLLDSGKKSALQQRSSYQPRRINKMFNPLNLIVMTLIIAILTTVFLIYPLNDRGTDNSFTEELRVVGSGLRVDSNVQAIPNPDSNTQDLIIDSAVESKTLQLTSIDQQIEKSSTHIEILESSPKDTIIDGTIFELTKEQLGMLGFKFDDEGYYYLNKMPDGSQSDRLLEKKLSQLI